jgi:hypothetical protein
LKFTITIHPLHEYKFTVFSFYGILLLYSVSVSIKGGRKMKKTIDLKSILVQLIVCTLLLTVLAMVVPLVYHETRWDISWDNVPDDIRSNYAKFRCMTVAGNGDLWAGNDNGVVHISGQTWNTFSSRILHHIRDIEVAPNGEVWVLTDRSDVLRYDGQDWQQMPSITGIREIAITSTGEVLGIVSNGPVQYDGENWQPMSLPINQTQICAISSASDGTIWAADCSPDFVLFHISNNQAVQSAPAKDAGYITKIDAAATTPIWTYSMGMKGGVNSVDYYQNEQWNIVSASKLILPWIGIDFIYDLSADPNGNAWVATPTGVCRFNKHYCVYYLKGESIYSVATAPDGSVWLGLENQIVKLSR